MKIKPKIGVVSCSGECSSVGTISRIAARKILEDLKPKKIVTICLPLFLAGDAGERNFAKKFPTIAVDGCHKHCATKAIEKHSGKTAFTINIEALLDEWCVDHPISRRELTSQDMETIVRVAQEISHHIDVIRNEING